MEGNVLILIWDLYRLKIDGNLLRSFVDQNLDWMGLKYCQADPEIYIRPAVKYYGMEYYKYILVYVDNLLAVSTNVIEALQDIQGGFKFNNNNIDIPSNYLDAGFKNSNWMAIWYGL